MRLMFKSLAFKISFFVISAMFLSLVVFSLVFILSERGKLSADIVKSGEVFANFSTRTIYDNYTQYYSHPQPEDFVTFKDNVQAVLASNRDIVKVSLVGINGRILFDSGELTDGKYEGEARWIRDSETIDLIKARETNHREIEEDGQKVTEIIVPIIQSGSHLFSVRYFVSQESLSNRMSEVYLQIISVVLPLLVVATIFATMFTITLTRPLKTLTKAAEKIRAGDFDIKTEVRSQDEIGRLASAFNEMAVKLKDSYGALEAKVRERTTELEKERGSLEKRVKERTAELEKIKVSLEQAVAERTKSLQEKLAEVEQLNKHMIGREMKMAEIKKELEALKRG